jgi:hypothetical protein
MRTPSPTRDPAVLPHVRPAWLSVSFFACVDYQASNCGPYRELLFVPGVLRAFDGRRHWSVSRIFVSTVQSLVNGRRNWGLPKELAQFDIVYGDRNGFEDRIVVKRAERTLADLRLRTSRLRVPATTTVVPRAARTVVQWDDSTEYVFTPSARGWLSPARVLSWTADAEVFPGLADATVLAAAKIVALELTVPPPQMQARNAQGGAGTARAVRE